MRRLLEVVVGARPNFVKAAALWRALDGGRFDPTLVHTGQHDDPSMSVAFGARLGLPEPHVRLAVPATRRRGPRLAAILVEYEAHLLEARRAPAAVVVIGDVDSTLAAALAAVGAGVPVVHLEAGLRSHDASMPEEHNRVAVDHSSTLLLASERSGVDHLASEGIRGDHVVLAGSLTVDTLLTELPAARASGLPRALGLRRGRYVLVTLHRPANVDTPARLRAIVDGLVEVAARMPVVLPAHPRTAARLAEAGLRDRVERTVRLVSPMSYHELVSVMDGAAVVVTDSGGIQEETTALGIPCLTLRSNTERPSTLVHGTNRLVGDDVRSLARLVEEAIERPRASGCEVEGWDGRAAERAVAAIDSAFG